MDLLLNKGWAGWQGGGSGVYYLLKGDQTLKGDQKLKGDQIHKVDQILKSD